MSTGTDHFSPLILTITVFFVITGINGLESRKLDENTLPGDQGGIKCTPSCVQSPPPPSPPPPCPPPPSPPVLPPPPPKKPPTQYCPPPPSGSGPSTPSPPSFIYITGPPGNLYPIDQNFGAGSRSFEVGLLALVSGFLVFLAL